MQCRGAERTSLGVSPLARSSTRNADVWQGSTPEMMARTPVSASWRERSRFAMSASINGLSSLDMVWCATGITQKSGLAAQASASVDLGDEGQEKGVQRPTPIYG